MSNVSPMLLIGIGTAGSAIATGINRAFGDGLRYLLLDTDAVSGQSGGPFVLLGGERLAGRGSGGDIVAGRLAAEESIHVLDEHLEGVRLAVIVTALGGGTGGGVTLEAAKYLAERGVPTVVFATSPFTFEGEDRQRNARGVMTMIEEAASATFMIPLDKLVGGIDNMDEAMQRAIGTMASGVTMFWRLVEKPGYIRLDSERLRHLIAGAGRGRFAAVTAMGPNRVAEIIDLLTRSELLTASSGAVKSILCGVLAGNDLLLSEIGLIADGIKRTFGGTTFDLATVNDEETFAGRISVVTMLFESGAKTEEDSKPSSVMGGRRRRTKGAVGISMSGRGARFKNVEPTVWNGEDLDVPTFLRKGLNLDL